MNDRMERQMAREEQEIYDAEERGEMTREQASKALRDLQRDYREAAREAAQEAYDREMDNW